MTAKNETKSMALVKAGNIATLQQYVAANQNALKQIAAESTDLRRIYRLIVNLIRQTPKLQDCTIASIFKAMQQAAEVNLEPGNALGLSYIVPYGQEAQFQIGYRGFINLARRSGEIASLQAFTVYEGDYFHVELGDTPSIKHEPKWDGDRSDKSLRFVYACARMKDGTLMIDVMTRSDVDKIRARSKSGNNGPWVTDFAEMARKTVVRRLSKYLPLSIQHARAVEIDENNDLGAIGSEAALSVLDTSTGEVKQVSSNSPALSAEDPLDLDITGGSDEEEEETGLSQAVAAIQR